MSDLYIYGASGHGRVVAEAALDSKLQIKGIIDDDPDSPGLFGIEVLPASRVPPKSSIVIAIGNPRIRSQISENMKGMGHLLATIVHPSAVIARSASIGKGTVVLAGSIVSSGARIGENCIINHNASIDHDCVIGDFVHTCPGSNLAGNVTIGMGTWVGLGANVLQGIRVGSWSYVGAGSTVIKDVADNLVVVGSPTRVLREGSYF